MWESDVISGSEIVEQLIGQYGINVPISFEVSDMSKQFPYKSTLLTFHCNRCGNEIKTTPKCILTAKETSGYPCTECAGKSDEEIREMRQEKMLEMGLDVIEDARKKGMLYEPENDTIVEEESAEDYNIIDADDEILDQNMFDGEETTTVANEEQHEVQEQKPIVQVVKSKEEKEIEKHTIKSDDDSEKASIADLLKSKNISLKMPKKEEEKNKSSAKNAGKNGKTQKETTQKQLQQNDSGESKRAASKENKSIEKEDEPIIVPTDSDENLSQEELYSMIETYGNSESISTESDTFEEEKPVQLTGSGMLSQEEIDSILETPKPQPDLEAIAQKEKETLERILQEREKAPKRRLTQEEIDDILDLKKQEEEKPEKKQKVAEPEKSSPVKPIKPAWLTKSKQIKKEPEKQKVEVPKEQMIRIGSLEFSSSALGSELKRVFTKLVNSPLKRVPYAGITHDVTKGTFEVSNDAIRVNDNYVGIKLVCDTCEQTFLIDQSLDTLADEVTVVDEQWCQARSITPRPDKYNVLHYCPHCLQSFVQNGFNALNKQKVIERFDSNNLQIVNPDNYYYFNKNAQYVVKPKGSSTKVPATVDFRAFCELFPVGKDASQAPFFKDIVVEQPKQSYAEEMLKPFNTTPDFKTKKESTDSPLDVKLERLPEFKGNLNQFSDKCMDTETILKENFEEKTAAPKTNVFHEGFKIKQSSKNKIASMNPYVNPFERKTALESEFSHSEFNDFIVELATICETQFKLIISERAYDIPIIDFESGIRIVCSNLDERAIANVPYLNIVDSIPFHFKKKYTSIVLFSDSIIYRRQATLDALVKHINPKILAYNGERIDITRWGLFKQYTTYAPFLSDFDQKYSTFPSGKPKTGELGIIASWEISENNSLKEAMNLSSLLTSGSGGTLESFEKDYGQYLVSSIRYIEQFNKKTQRVMYHITEYNEIGSALIADGLLLCIRALLKEYMTKYPQLSTITPHIIIEIDPNTYFSPSLIPYIEKKTLVPMDVFYKSQIEDRQIMFNSMKPPVEQHHRYSYIRKPEYRVKDKDCMRWDMRMFQPGTLINRMADEIKQAGLQVSIFDNNVRTTFIYNMGYTKLTQLDIKEFFVNQSFLSLLMTDSDTISLTKMADPDAYMNTRMVNNTSDGRSINNILLNPTTLNRYRKIMESGTLEAQNYLQNAIYQNQMMDQGVQQAIMNGWQPQMMPPTFVNPMMGMQQPMM